MTNRYLRTLSICAVILAAQACGSSKNDQSPHADQSAPQAPTPPAGAAPIASPVTSSQQENWEAYYVNFATETLPSPASVLTDFRVSTATEPTRSAPGPMARLFEARSTEKTSKNLVEPCALP